MRPTARAETDPRDGPSVRPLPLAAPALRLARFRAAIEEALARVLSSGRLILGPEVEAFERQLASYLGVAHCVGVASGTDALALALRALGVGDGDEVATVAMTAPATAVAIRAAGAAPRFVEIDPATRNMDPRALAAAINPRTAAVVPVHLHGAAAPMREIQAIAERHGLAVVEDCAQACGATLDGRRLGSFGHASAFSFYPTKNLGALGDGGAVVTRDPAIAERVRRFRHYGLDAARRAAEWGCNSRLDEIQAAILSILLPQLDAYNAVRRQVARAYREDLAGMDIALPADAEGSIYHHFAIALEGRDQVAQSLAARGVATAVHYSPPLHRHPAFAAGGARLPETERLAARTLSLPIQPEIAQGRTREIAGALRACLA